MHGSKGARSHASILLSQLPAMRSASIEAQHKRNHPPVQRLGVGGMLSVLVGAPDHMYFDV